MLLQQLITFSRVAEEHSYTRAAELLNLSQPAVTRQVAALEAELSTQLTEGAGRGFRLTPAGEVVFRYAREVVALVGRCREEVGALADPERGQVSVACVTTVGLFTLPGLIVDFRRHYPDVRIRVWSGRLDGLLDRLLNGSADLGLASSPVLHPRLISLPLFDDPVIPVAAPSVARSLPAPMPVALLAELDVILYDAPSRFRTLVDAAFAQVGIEPRVSMEFDSHEAVRTAVSLGYGVAFVPQEAVTAELERGTLVRLTVEGLPPISRTTSLILRRHDPSRLPAVLNFVRQTLDRYRRTGSAVPDAAIGADQSALPASFLRRRASSDGFDRMIE